MKNELYEKKLNNLSNIIYSDVIDNKKEQINLEKEECCICLEEKKAFSFKTNCSHDICIECLLQMKKSLCPLCR